MQDDLWKKFTLSGSVNDYLQYRNNEKNKDSYINANENKGDSNKRTDGGGERQTYNSFDC